MKYTKSFLITVSALTMASNLVMASAELKEQLEQEKTKTAQMQQQSDLETQINEERRKQVFIANGQKPGENPNKSNWVNFRDGIEKNIGL